MGIGSRITPTNAPKIPVAANKTTATVEFQASDPLYRLDDLILPDGVKDKILDVASYAEDSELVFKHWGLEKTHKYSRKIGVNLWGPPGTGKTMAAHAIASSLQRNILTVSYADIESKYVGETPKNIRKAFETAKETNSIIFFDEADAILSRRVTNMTNATDVSVNQTRSVLLMILNDYQDIVIFATNFIENFDPAFMRRISMHIQFELPDYECRYKLWQKYIPEEMPNNLNIKKMSLASDGLTGSDISNVILMAAFKAARQHSEIVEDKFVIDMIENVLASKRANSKLQPVREKKKLQNHM